MINNSRNKYGLTERDMKTLEGIFLKYPEVREVRLFGSRAKGNFKHGSDIDLAVMDKEIDSKTISNLSFDFEESSLPYTVDVINFSTLKHQEFIEHIDRVGIVFYERWKEVKLKDYVNVTNGYAFKSSNFLNNRVTNALPIVKIKNVANGDVHLDDVQYHLYEPSLSKFLIERDDILIALTGNHPEVMTQVVGETSHYKLNEKALLNQRVAKIVSKEGLNKSYLYYFLKDEATHDALASNSAGSANQANISKADIENLSIFLPLLKEQTSIASILRSLDDKINLLKRQNKTLEQLAETLFRQWFVEEASEDWELTTLENHTEVFRGLSYKGSGLTGINLGIPMHNLNSVCEGGGYKYEGIKFYSGDYRERHLLNVGDIIITNTEQGHEHKLIGFPAIIPDFYGEKGVFSQHIYKLQPLPQTYLSKQFIYYLLMSQSIREQIVAATNGSTVNMLAIDGLQRPIFKLPLKEKINTFTLIVKDYWIKKNVNQNQIRILLQIRDTLLPKLMSGEVRVIN